MSEPLTDLELAQRRRRAEILSEGIDPQADDTLKKKLADATLIGMNDGDGTFKCECCRRWFNESDRVEGDDGSFCKGCWNGDALSTSASAGDAG